MDIPRQARSDNGASGALLIFVAPMAAIRGKDFGGVCLRVALNIPTRYNLIAVRTRARLTFADHRTGSIAH